MEMIRGCDLSHWNSEKVFDYVFNYADFFILKATESISMKDNTCRKRLDKLIKAGKCTGIYHFFRHSDINKQVDNFLSVFQDYIGLTVPFLDVEINNVNWNDVRDFLDKIEAATRVRPVLYVDMGRFKLCPEDIKEKNKIWLARYIKWEPDKIFAINKNIICWQYTKVAVFNGQMNKLDGDYFNGSYSDFMKYARVGE